MRDIKRYLHEISSTPKNILCNRINKEVASKLYCIHSNFFVKTFDDSKPEYDLEKNISLLPALSNEIIAMIDYDAILLCYDFACDASFFFNVSNTFNIPVVTLFNFKITNNDLARPQVAQGVSSMCGTLNLTSDKETHLSLLSINKRCILDDFYQTETLNKILNDEE